MPANTYTIILLIALLVFVGWFFWGQERFELPQGTTVSLENETQESKQTISLKKESATEVARAKEKEESLSGNSDSRTSVSNREVFVTDGTKHSIPLNEILSGGPPKDGIPSIDKPKFVSADDADDFLESESVGLGLVVSGEARFYPYQILVWHEIVNDTIVGKPILVTYCPLCATGVVFDRRVNGIEQEFGVSGLLWKSNLLMYNRTRNPDTESLWSQVLGEAVLGPETGDKLLVVRSDTVRYGEWKKKYPETRVLSRETGTFRNYGSDPYGSYYTDDSVGFGATFNDNRLHPKAFVLGIELAGHAKAYPIDALPLGATQDFFQGERITIEKSGIDEVDFFVGEEKQPLSTIDGFWFSWLAVHPETELYK